MCACVYVVVPTSVYFLCDLIYVSFILDNICDTQFVFLTNVLLKPDLGVSIMNGGCGCRVEMCRFVFLITRF